MDGYIIVKNDRYVELQNEDGKKVATERYQPLGGLKEGNTLEVASYELEVQNPVAEDDYISGRLFVKPTIQAIIARPNKAKSLSNRTPFKPLRPMNGVSKTKSAEHANAPMHDPKVPGACILLPATHGVIPGKKTIPVVLDPFLGKRMRPHQREGIKFLYNCVQGSYLCTGEGGQGAILADEMGLGKSMQAIALIWTLLKQSPKGSPLVKKAVIVCPASLVTNWVNEIKKWLGFERLKPVQVTSGSSTYEAKEALAGFLSGTVRRLLVISYEMFRSYSEQLYKSNIGLLVCDEGHRLKSSHGNKTIEALRKLPCRRRVILTGTPVQNDLGEFFAVCDFVNPGCLNSLASFRSVFANTIIASRDSNAQSNVVRLGEARAKELGRITSAFVLRRTSNILAKYLPPKVEVAIFCRLQAQQEVEYRTEAKNRFADVSNSARFSAALSAINFLRKICCHPVLVNQGIFAGDEEEFSELIRDVNEAQANDGKIPKDFKISDSGKMQVALSICHESLAVGDKVILVSNYTSTLDLLQQALSRKSISYCRLDGSTAVNQRGDIVRRFNQGTIGDVFLLSAKAGGVGLNLIGANRLILFDPDWNPATDLQAMARVWRDGQKKNVYVYRLLSTGTIEEKIFQRQLFKGELQSAVDGEKDGGSEKLMGSKEGNFSAEELRDLFQYNASHQYCDTLEVLERSQEDAALVHDRVINRPLSLLQRFLEYKNTFESQDGCKAEVFCGEDVVLDKALNGDPDAHGIVSYLYSKHSGQLAAHAKADAGKFATVAPSDERENQPLVKQEECKPRRAKRIGPTFESDSEDKSSSDDDAEVEILAAMRRSRNKRARKEDAEQNGAIKRQRKSPKEEDSESKEKNTASEEPATLHKEKEFISKGVTTWDEAIDELESDSFVGP